MSKWNVFLSSIIVVFVIVGAVGCDKQKATAQEPGAKSDATPTAASTVNFASDIKPILDKYCHDCHLNGGTKGGFSLETRESALLEGRHGARIVAGNSAGSDLIKRISSTERGKMPPKGDRVSAEEIAKLSAWIDQGAQW